MMTQSSHKQIKFHLVTIEDMVPEDCLLYTSSTTNMSIHADTLAQKLADLHGTSALNLNAPAVVSDLNLAVSLRKEESIAKVLEAGKKVDIALVGIGNLSEGATNIQLGSLRKQDVDELRRQGAVASVCSSYLDKDGREVGQEILERSIGQSLKDLKKSRIIAAAIGDSKVEAIKAAPVSYTHLDVYKRQVCD